MFDNGEIVEAVQEQDGPAESGYLVVCVGDRVEVLHSEGDWVYARLAHDGNKLGWLTAEALRAPQPAWLHRGAVVSSVLDIRPVTGTGYLAAAAGDSIAIQYVGDKAS